MSHWSSSEQRRAFGRGRRSVIRRIDQGIWKPASNRPDPVRALLAANRERIQELLPIKWGRMAASPFAFLRGAAPLMAADLARWPTTGIQVQLCGDAHIGNLGAYATPDGHLVFDLNDFDETIRGPWEWDVKRLATSLLLAGVEAGAGKKGCVEAVRRFVRAYREAMDAFAAMKVIELAKWQVRRRTTLPAVRQVLHKAERVTPEVTLKKLTVRGNTRNPRFHDRAPILWHVPSATAKAALASLSAYRETLAAERRQFFDAYRPADVAFKVVGTGSIGTRDYVVLLLGNGPGDVLFLQLKQALASCYCPYLRDPSNHLLGAQPKATPSPRPSPPRRSRQVGISVRGRIEASLFAMTVHGPNARGEHVCTFHEGQRVVEGQRRIQTSSDPLLGWTSIQGCEFLVRQLADHKAVISPDELKGGTLIEYALVCGEILAKAHARTGDAAAISGYCGKSVKLDDGIAAFASVYADQMRSDHGLLKSAIESGRVKAKFI